MRIVAIALVALVASSGMAASATPPASPTALLEKQCGVIRNSLKKADDAEKERWNRNLGLWQMVIDKQGKLQDIDYEKFETDLHELNGRVAPLPENPEHDRWDAGLALWQLTLDVKGDLAQSPVGDLDKWYEDMKRRTAAARDANARKRWTANVAMWTSVLPASVTAPNPTNAPEAK